MTKHVQPTIPTGIIERKIYLVRGHKVMLDSNLAELYGVEVKALKAPALTASSSRLLEDTRAGLTRM